MEAGRLLASGHLETCIAGAGDHIFPFLYRILRRFGAPGRPPYGEGAYALSLHSADTPPAGALARLSVPLSDGRFDTVLQASAGRRGLPGFAPSPTPDDWQRDGRLLLAARYACGAPGGLTLAKA